MTQKQPTSNMMKNDPIVVEQTYNAPLSKVWAALTDRNDMKQWYFDIAEFKPEIGFEFQFLAGSDNKKYMHRCKISEVTMGKKISYSWQYDGYEGYSFVSFELHKAGQKTKITLTHTGVETFPMNNSDFARESFVKGWTYIIGTSLKKFIEKSTSMNEVKA